MRSDVLVIVNCYNGRVLTMISTGGTLIPARDGVLPTT
jgi:hypothetical protein